MTNLQEKIKAYFKTNEKAIKDEILELLKSLVRQKTVNVVTEQLPQHPYLKCRGEEYRAAEIIKKKFASEAIAFDEFARMKERPNIIGSLGRKTSGKSLFMAGHMDIVPAGDGWDTDPFEALEKDGKVYGRGTMDNKGPLASIVVAACILKRLGIDKELNGELQVAALADEEATDPDGIDYGIKYLLENKLVKPTYAVIPDIGEDMLKIDVAEKGISKIKITAIGKQAHGSTPEKGVNAIHLMGRLLVEIEKLKLKHEVHPVLGHPTFNVGMINGGAAPNIVPGSCSIVIDIRTVPGMNKDELVREFTDVCARIGSEHFRVELAGWGTPHSINPDNELVKAIQKISLDNMGFVPETYGLGGGTFAKNLCLDGTTAVGWGPGNGDLFHVANEYAEVKQLLNFSLITCLLAIDLIG